jgi:hypothetical protein
VTRGSPKSFQWRRCNTCGYVAWRKDPQHRIYPKGLKGQRVLCGYMRVIREGMTDDPR